MKKILLCLGAATMILTSCGGKSTAEKTEAEEAIEVAVPADGSYDSAATDELIQSAKDGEKLSQAYYAAVINQCSAINRLLIQKLSDVEFKSGMTDEEINAAMDKLQNDSLLPRLEAQNRELLVILQNAKLDSANTRRYETMVEEVRKGLDSRL